MSINDQISYHVGYLEDNEFWSRIEVDSFEEANQKLSSYKEMDKTKQWIIFEKLVIFRKAYDKDKIDKPY
jgi:hypothetical protein